jgi:acetyl-CoA acetyltransferase
MSEYTLKDKVAVVGIAETKYYKHGGSPVSEFQLCLEAILKAAADAGLDPRAIDGFSSYSDDRNQPVRIAAALGTPDLALSVMEWGGGGGGGSGAVANAAAGLVAGLCNYAVVYRGLAQGQFGRFGQSRSSGKVPYPMSYSAPYGMMAAAQNFAARVHRFMYEYGATQDPMKAISLTSYYHAQRNPRAIMYGRPLTAEDYDNSRWIVEPFHLFDCCQENDGAAALILTTAERARDLQQKPAWLMAAAIGSDYRQAAPAHNAPDYATSNFKTLAPRLYGMAGIEPKDVDVVQSYENFTGGVMMSLVEHGFCQPEEVDEFMTFDTFRFDGGKLPLNTSGGNLAECYMHGLELNIEAVRQIRGTSTAQVPNVEVSMVCSGPMVQPVTSMILHS